MFLKVIVHITECFGRIVFSKQTENYQFFFIGQKFKKFRRIIGIKFIKFVFKLSYFSFIKKLKKIFI